MSYNCEFYFEREKKDWCAIKQGRIEYKTYCEYCKNDNSKQCPFFIMYQNEKKR